MKKNILNWGLLIVVAVLLVTGLTVSAAAADKKFGLDNIPEIKNKRAIHVALADLADIVVPYLRKFQEKTGIKVTHEIIVFNALYSKEIMELQGRTGAYDVVVAPGCWTMEWKDYLYPMKDLAKKYDPEGIEGLQRYLAGHDPGMLRTCSTTDGTLMGIPVQTYTMLQVYRKDVFDNPAEKEAFKKKYGYELAPAKTWEQNLDLGEFFTRKKGEKLKGDVLKHNIYGFSMMAGRYPHVQDEIDTRLWSRGGDWASPVRKGGLIDGTNPIGFKITEKDKKLLEWAFENYQKSMKYTPPGTDNAYWDFACAEFAAGNTMMINPLYSSIWSLAAQVEEKVPGAKIGGAPTPGLRPFTGPFFLSPSVDSKNPEAAYWVLKYIGSYEVQKAMADAGWATPRVDVLMRPEYAAPKYHKSLGWIPSVLLAFERQNVAINDYLDFNSAAFGKLYDEMMIVAHENAVGKRTPKESVNEWVKRFNEIQTKFGKLPVIK